MGLLTPDPGLLFWMVVVFGIVFFLLAKFGFQLANVKIEGEKILAQAHEEQARILKSATETRDRIIREAQEKARLEGDRLMEEMKKQIETEKESAIRDIRRQVALLSVGIAEKVMRTKLADEKEQTELISRLVDEMVESSK